MPTRRDIPDRYTAPETHNVKAYRGIGSLSLRIPRGYPLPPYSVKDGIAEVARDVLYNRTAFGEFNLDYDYLKSVITINNVFLADQIRGKGIGAALYTEALSIPLPDGTDPRRQGFVFRSSNDNEASLGVWEHLAHRGLARKMGRSSFEMR